MKRFVSLFLVVAVLAMAVPVAFAQDTEGTDPPKQKLQMYHVVLAKKGPNWKSQNTDEGMDIRMEIIQNVRKAAAEGLIVSGGLVNDETDVEFILIFNVETKTEVYNIMQKAVHVKNGHYSVEAYSWFAPVGLVWQQ